MSRILNKLSPTKIRNLKRAGLHSDGGGLYVFVKPAGTKYWVFRYTQRSTKKIKTISIGPIADVKADQARERARDYRNMIRDHLDPVTEREKLKQELLGDQRITFGDAALEYIETHKAGWSNEKHQWQWKNSLERYCKPIWKTDVSAVDRVLVLRCLSPQWEKMNETVGRVRGRMERILDWAAVHGYRAGENPARWKGNLEHSLAAPSKVKKVVHQPALPYAKINAFLTKLREKGTVSARAIEFQVLTAARPGEACSAHMDEINLDARIWTVPASKTKMKKDHEIPLSGRAVELIKATGRKRGYLFPSRDSHITTTGTIQMTKKMKFGSISNHGFRSTFRDWAAEQTTFQRDVIEHALAHQLPDKVEAAYYRSKQLPKRAQLMQDWSDYCDREQKDAKVTSIKKASKKTA